jgi:hypothetical protein
MGVHTLNVERWDTCEFSFAAAKSYANPFRDVSLNATLIHALTGARSGASLNVDGFYDGGDTWRLRLMPDQVGTWGAVARSLALSFPLSL